MYDSWGKVLSVTENTIIIKNYIFSRYYYDNGGNLTRVTATPFGTNQTTVTTGTYSYTNTNWPDQLTAYNGVTITYDSMGNPLSYYNGDNYTFTWKDGRKLATLTKGNTTASYKYNADGIRYEKTVGGVVHKYYLMGSSITAETIIDGIRAQSRILCKL